MKKPLTNETEMLETINKMQALLIMLDKKVDTIIHRSLSEAKQPAAPGNDRTARVMHKAICADCKKECTIPFKPSADRPIYCQDCFSRRKVIKLSGIKVDDKPQEAEPIQKPQGKAMKKAVAGKKSVVKKKPVPKKK